MQAAAPPPPPVETRADLAAAAGFFLPRAIALALVLGAIGVALWPIQTLALTIVLGAAVVAARNTAAGAALVGVAAGAAGLAVWPAFTLFAIAITAVAVFAVRSPLYGLALALALFGTEGTIKAELTYGSSPTGVDAVVLGAAFLDAALAVGVAGVVWPHRDELRRVWAQLDRLTRIGLVALSAWLAVSIPQIFQSGHPVRGLDGFRVTQAYLLVGVAAFVAVRAARAERVLSVLLAASGAVAAYGAFRAAVGASPTEAAFVLTRPGVTTYGDVVRTAGSFSGAVGLASFAVPVAVFAFGIALLSPAHRRVALGVFAFAAAASIATYSRAAVVGLVIGIVLVSALGIPRASKHQRRLALGLVAATIAAAVAATAAASLANAQTRERAAGFVNPFDDRSMQIRYETWKHSVREIGRHPLGKGLGTVGRASALSGTTVTADNSYLKVFLEQGILVGVLFLVGLVALFASAISGVGRARAASHPFAVACLGGFAAFLAMAFFGEFVEQPGKAVAWTLLGAALAVTTASPPREAAP